LGGVEWIELAQGRDRWRAVVSAMMNLRVLAPGVSWLDTKVLLNADASYVIKNVVACTTPLACPTLDSRCLLLLGNQPSAVTALLCFLVVARQTLAVSPKYQATDLAGLSMVFLTPFMHETFPLIHFLQ
jgi:hypothetical protein